MTVVFKPHYSCLTFVPVDFDHVRDVCVDSHARVLGEPVKHAFTVGELYPFRYDSCAADP